MLSTFLPSNTSLSDLNLASNNIGDTGGQRIVKSLKHHKRMQKFNVSQNDIADGACFVVAQVSSQIYFICFLLFTWVGNVRAHVRRTFFLSFVFL